MVASIKKRIGGWILVVLGMANVVAGAIAGHGVNMWWAIIAMLGAGLVGPWPWFPKEPTRNSTKPDNEFKHETGTDVSKT